MSSRDDDYPYPEDEFDALGADRTPQGVHRTPLSRWRQLLPFLLVLVLAPTLAFVVVRVLTGTATGPADTEPTVEQPTTVEESGEPSGEPTDEPTDAEPTDQPTESTDEPSSEEPAGELDYSTQIWVLNGAGVSGLAAEVVGVLTETGWLDANADDYGSAAPSVTTIYYDNADQADEAQAVADELGITSPLVESADAADGDVVVVLRSDFELP